MKLLELGEGRTILASEVVAILRADSFRESKQAMVIDLCNNGAPVKTVIVCKDHIVYLTNFGFATVKSRFMQVVGKDEEVY